VRFQLTSDGLQAYIPAADQNQLDGSDYVLVKTYATNPQEHERRYPPAVCTGPTKVVARGSPDGKRICTSHVERQNLIMRMQIRRLTRLNERAQPHVGGQARLALRIV